MAKPVITNNLYRMNQHPPGYCADCSAGFSYTIDWTHSRDAVTYPPMQRPHRWFHIGFLLSLLLAATVTSAADFASRSFLNAGGRIIEYTDGEENLALELGAQIDQVFARDNAVLPPPAIELSPAEIPQHLKGYLAAHSRYPKTARAPPQKVTAPAPGYTAARGKVHAPKPVTARVSTRAITGTLGVGSKLTLTRDPWYDRVESDVIWRRDGVPIDGAYASLDSAADLLLG